MLFSLLCPCSLQFFLLLGLPIFFQCLSIIPYLKQTLQNRKQFLNIIVCELKQKQCKFLFPQSNESAATFLPQCLLLSILMKRYRMGQLTTMNWLDYQYKVVQNCSLATKSQFILPIKQEVAHPPQSERKVERVKSGKQSQHDD